MERYLTEAQKGLHKMSLSIKSLMFSANPFKAPPRASDTLLNLLQDAIKIMMFQASDQRVQVDFRAPPEFEKIVTEADLYYVFINIIKNALQAMPQGGRLEVDCSLHDRQVEISFQDNGPGLTPEEMDQIFQPFYSTKEELRDWAWDYPSARKSWSATMADYRWKASRGRGPRCGCSSVCGIRSIAWPIKTS